MVKLSIGQLKQASEILGNLAVAWFSAGIISPLLVRPKTLSELVSVVVLGLGMSVLFTLVSLSLVKGVKS